ncbi:MAG: hypothetical protein ACLTMP_09130 [Eggerthella lenta]
MARRGVLNRSFSTSELCRAGAGGAAGGGVCHFLVEERGRHDSCQ